MGLYEDINRAGLLSIGLIPEWVDISSAEYLAPPDSDDAGVYLQNSPRVNLSVDLREEVHRRTARVVVGTADLTTTVYTVTINGTAVAYDASSALPANATALVAGIAAALEANGTVGPLVVATADPAAPTTTILIKGVSSADFSIAIGVAGGTGTLSCNADAASCTVRIYYTAGGIVKTGSTGSGRWKSPASGVWTSILAYGLWDKLDCGGAARAAVTLSSITGHASDGGSVTLNIARVMVGPSVLEAT